MGVLVLTQNSRHGDVHFAEVAQLVQVPQVLRSFVPPAAALAAVILAAAAAAAAAAGVAAAAAVAPVLAVVQRLVLVHVVVVVVVVVVVLALPALLTGPSSSSARVVVVVVVGIRVPGLPNLPPPKAEAAGIEVPGRLRCHTAHIARCGAAPDQGLLRAQLHGRRDDVAHVGHAEGLAAEKAEKVSFFLSFFLSFFRSFFLSFFLSFCLSFFLRRRQF